MKIAFLLGVASSVALLSVTTYADSIENLAIFTGNGGPLTSSVLGATIAASHVDFHPAIGAAYQGNRISNSTAGGGFGITAISQNTGAGAINQQSVTVHIGQLTLPSATGR